ncbi:MAG: TetR/AcrR family transcriptional regulator [Rhodococcus sp. (in: high G+C Gram-positive bacteria)]
MKESSASTRDSTRLRIVDAAARLLQEDGPAAVTTRGVAEAAGVQAPTIYRLFGDKNGLLDAIAEHVMATYVSVKAEIVGNEVAENGDPVEDLRTGWRAQIEFGIANPTLFALLSDPARGPESPAVREGAAILATRVHRIARTGRLRVTEQRAVELIHSAGTGAVLTILGKSPEHRDVGLADELFEAVMRHIVVDAPRYPESSVQGAAIALRALTSEIEVLSTAERQLLTEWLDRISE